VPDLQHPTVDTTSLAASVGGEQNLKVKPRSKNDLENEKTAEKTVRDPVFGSERAKARTRAADTFP